MMPNTPENENLTKVQDKINYLKGQLDILNKVIENGKKNINELLGKTEIERLEREITRAIGTHGANRRDIIGQINRELESLKKLSAPLIKISDANILKDVHALTENLEKVSQELNTQCEKLRGRIKELENEKIQQMLIGFRNEADRLYDQLESLDKPIYELQELGLLVNVKPYLNEVKDFIQMAQGFKEKPQIEEQCDDIIEMYQDILAKIILANEYIEIFTQLSSSLELSQIPTNDTKLFLEKLIKSLKELRESPSKNALKKFLQFFESEFNAEQRYIPQIIKIKMLELYQKITDIRGLPQIQYFEALLKKQIDLQPFFLNVKTILDKSFNDLAVTPNIIEQINSFIREADNLLENRVLKDLVRINKQEIIPMIDSAVNAINEKKTALISLRQKLLIRSLAEKYIQAFKEDLRQEQNQEARKTLNELLNYLKICRGEPAAYTLKPLSCLLQSKLNTGDSNNIPNGIKNKMCSLLNEVIVRLNELSQNETQSTEGNQNILSRQVSSKSSDVKTVDIVLQLQPQRKFFLNQKISTDLEKEYSTAAFQKYANTLGIFSSHVTTYLNQRGSFSIPKNFIYSIFGTCSLKQKKAAATDLKRAINGEISIADLDNKHKKALNQGNLGELYNELKPKLLAMIDIQKAINGEITFEQFEINHTKALSKVDFQTFYNEIKSLTDVMLRAERNLVTINSIVK
jgi:hypothetical protein